MKHIQSFEDLVSVPIETGYLFSFDFQGRKDAEGKEINTNEFEILDNYEEGDSYVHVIGANNTTTYTLPISWFSHIYGNKRLKNLEKTGIFK